VTTNKTFGGLFLTPFRKIGGSLSKRKIPQRTLLHNFSGSVKEGEMLLVLGRPGSGCSTFLKTIALQTEGYESVEGGISYGGLTPKEVEKYHRGQVVYNQGVSHFDVRLTVENDIHYAALTVQQTLAFALKTRTPKQPPEGMSQKIYRNTFLKALLQMFGIGHTVDTRVGNEVMLCRLR
jgi:ATP-binding cassette, subfamily G (WHITE), member 2, SNQ2